MREQEWQLLVDDLQMTTKMCTRRSQYGVFGEIVTRLRFGGEKVPTEEGIALCSLVEGLIRLSMLRFNPYASHPTYPTSPARYSACTKYVCTTEDNTLQFYLEVCYSRRTLALMVVEDKDTPRGKCA